MKRRERRAVEIEVPLRRFDELDAHTQQAIIRDIAAMLVRALRRDMVARGGAADVSSDPRVGP